MPLGVTWERRWVEISKPEKVDILLTPMTDQQPIADKESKQQAAGIVSYCIEYASSQGDKCTECRKRIIKGSLRAGEIHRKSKSEKKNKAERTWWHFNCWKGRTIQSVFQKQQSINIDERIVPERLTIVPIEQFRGYLKLKEKVRSFSRRKNKMYYIFTLRCALV